MPDSAADNRPSTPSSPAAIRVRPGSRLHFGLLDTAPPFGGIGVMIADPASEVIVSHSECFDAGPIEATRITQIAQRIARLTETAALPSLRVELTQFAPQHTGLGSGTQLSLAVADAMCRLLKIELTPEQLAIEIAGRGKRSAVGWHGYFNGGLIFEASVDQPPSQTGKKLHGAERSHSVQQRVELPASWTVLVVRPHTPNASVSGKLETQQFRQLPKVAPSTVLKLRSHIEQQLIPAAKAADFDAFADALTSYNAGSGELFRSVQSGPYNGPTVTALINWLHEQGIRGIGQSSWGPGVFAWFEQRSEAEQLVQAFPDWIDAVAITHPLNTARQLSHHAAPEY